MFPTLIDKTYEDKNLIVLTLQCSTDLLDSQIDLARDMAKNILQQTGAEVTATSTVLHYRTEAEGVVKINVEVEETEQDTELEEESEN